MNNKRLALSLSKGFTLVEVLIVITLAVMLMLASSTLFMTFLLGSSKLQKQQQVKQEGEYALSQMEFLLRNAINIVPNTFEETCELDMPEIVFTSIDGGQTKLAKEFDPADNAFKIASNSGVYLTSGEIEIAEGPTFNCSQSEDGLLKYIEIYFQLRKGTVGVDLERDIIEQEFRTGVGVRSF